MGAGSDLEITIKTRADLKGARDLESALKAQVAAAKRLGIDASGAEAQLKKVQASIKAAPIKSGLFHQAADGLRKIREQGGATATAINGFSSLISAPFAAAAATVGALTAALAGATHAVREYAKADEEIVTVDAALAQNQLLTEENRAKYQELADELERTTTIAGGTWMHVLAQLTNFGSRPETVGMDIEAVKNLAALLDGGEGGVTQAAKLWSLALNGNFTWLRRLGITLDETLPKHKRLQAVQEELAARGGGQLEARAKSLSGEFRTLKNQKDKFLEGVGEMIWRSGHLIVVMQKLGLTAGTYLTGALNGLFQQTSKLTNASKATVRSTDDAAEAMGTYAMKVEEAVRAIQNLQRAQDEIADAELAARLSVVDSAEKRGAISSEEAVRRRYALRQGAADAKLDNSIVANSATIRTLAGRLPAMEASGDEAGARGIQQQIRDLDSANQQAVRLRNVGRFTDSMGVADEIYGARSSGLPQGAVTDTKAGMDMLGKAFEDSLDKIVNRLLEKAAKLEAQIQRGPGR